MTTQSGNRRSRHQGMVLITALLLLIVVTILAVGMFRSFGLDEKIAGNVREKHRAVNAAESAEQYAEWWLSIGNGSNGITCTATVTAAAGQVCANPLATPTVLPWPLAVTFTPGTPTAMNVTGLAGGQGTYYLTPSFYITYLGLSPNGLGSVYQIDAVGYGGSADTAAVVESTYLVQQSVKDLGGQ
jgi:type IV pilus assembly protein PilX